MAGGGARAAYQIGVLRAISRMMPPGRPTPFQIICGTSAGAINGAVLACSANDFRYAVKRLIAVWGNFRVGHVFRADPVGILKTSANWLSAMMLAGFGRSTPLYLLDRTPLEGLLSTQVNLADIRNHIDSGDLDAFSITASGYTTGQSVTFFQGHDGLERWQRAQRVGCRDTLTIAHLMASSAIPFIFKPIRINREFFGDGSMRQFAPISPAIHLGAERIFVIGNRCKSEDQVPRPERQSHPTMAQIAGHILDSIFLDGLDADLERLQRINRTISLIPSHHLVENGISLRPIETLSIAPSRDLGKIAAAHAHELPRSIRYLLKSIGGFRRGGASLVSYLLFERGYCRELIRLGYEDAMAQRERILEFLRDPGEGMVTEEVA